MKLSTTIYQMSSDFRTRPEWKYAYGIDRSTNIVSWNCVECGRVVRNSVGGFGVRVEGGESFPDFLYCGAYPYLIVSSTVIRALRSNGVAEFVSYPVVVHLNGLGDHVDIPDYHQLEVLGQCKVDLIASGIEITSLCRRCGELGLDTINHVAYSIFSDSWDGIPLFQDRQLLPRVIFCTSKVKDILEKAKCTNMRFRPVEIVP